MDKLIGLGQVNAIPSTNAVRYYFTDRKGAEEARQAIIAKGFADAFVVGAVDEHIIPAEE